MDSTNGGTCSQEIDQDVSPWSECDAGRSEDAREDIGCVIADGPDLLGVVTIATS